MLPGKPSKSSNRTLPPKPACQTQPASPAQGQAGTHQISEIDPGYGSRVDQASLVDPRIDQLSIDVIYNQGEYSQSRVNPGDSASSFPPIICFFTQIRPSGTYLGVIPHIVGRHQPVRDSQYPPRLEMY